MEMEVLVRIHMIELEAGSGEGAVLRTDFRCQLPAHACVQQAAEGVPYHAVAEAPVAPHQVGDLARPQHGPAIGEYQVESDLQLWKSARQGNGLRGRGRAHHEARGTQHTDARSPFHRLVYRWAQAEVIGGDDELALAACEAHQDAFAVDPRSRRPSLHCQEMSAGTPQRISRKRLTRDTARARSEGTPSVPPRTIRVISWTPSAAGTRKARCRAACIRLSMMSAARTLTG